MQPSSPRLPGRSRGLKWKSSSLRGIQLKSSCAINGSRRYAMGMKLQFLTHKSTQHGDGRCLPVLNDLSSQLYVLVVYAYEKKVKLTVKADNRAAENSLVMCRRGVLRSQCVCVCEQSVCNMRVNIRRRQRFDVGRALVVRHPKAPVRRRRVVDHRCPASGAQAASRPHPIEPSPPRQRPTATSRLADFMFRLQAVRYKSGRCVFASLSCLRPADPFSGELGTSTTRARVIATLVGRDLSKVAAQWYDTLDDRAILGVWKNSVNNSNNNNRKTIYKAQ